MSGAKTGLARQHPRPPRFDRLEGRLLLRVVFGVEPMHFGCVRGDRPGFDAPFFPARLAVSRSGA
jgi:hypothetical protein